jgi:hypothetical protein
MLSLDGPFEIWQRIVGEEAMEQKKEKPCSEC